MASCKNAFLCTLGTDIVFGINAEIIFFYAQKCLTLPVSVTGSNTDDEPNFPRQSNLVSQKILWRKQSSYFTTY